MGDIITSTPVIAGVSLLPLKQIPDDRGGVMHVLRADSSHFEQFGEVYVSCVKRGAVKAWKKHLRMKQNLAVPAGKIRMVIYDDREESASKGTVQEVITGASNYGLLVVPSGVWYGFQGIGEGESLIVNCATIPHDPLEVVRIDSDDNRIPYRWSGTSIE
jgi:dTDP-4-dehydrorhamnose 3,5-epimerase